jgi:hypothetical protein
MFQLCGHAAEKPEVVKLLKFDFKKSPAHAA